MNKCVECFLLEAVVNRIKSLRLPFIHLVATIFSLFAAGCSIDKAPVEKPNILFIAIDDLRPDLGCYGNEDIITPNIDRLANMGLVFNKAYCQQAICNPTRASLLTGMRPDAIKVWDLRTHFRTAIPDVVTLPEHFKNNDYLVEGMDKIFHGGYGMKDPQCWSNPKKNPQGHQPYADSTMDRLALRK